MKKNKLISVIIFFCFSMISYSQCPIPVENWSFSVLHFTNPLDPETDIIYPQYDDDTYACEKELGIRLNWVLNPDGNPNTEFLDWEDISHFKLSFEFVDPEGGNQNDYWVQHDFIIQKTQFEYVDWNDVGPGMWFTENYPNSYLVSLSESGYVRNLNVRMSA